MTAPPKPVWTLLRAALRRVSPSSEAMPMSKRHKTQTAILSDLGPEIIDPTTGELRRAVPLVVEDVAVGVRATVKRGRRREAWEGVKGLTPGMHQAALAYRQAWEHLSAGRGLGPMPWAADRVADLRHDGLGVTLLPQERALSSSEWHRRGVQAMGLAASQGVVNWVVLRGGSLADYDEMRRWRRHTAREQLLAALERLAAAYNCT